MSCGGMRISQSHMQFINAVLASRGFGAQLSMKIEEKILHDKCSLQD